MIRLSLAVLVGSCVLCLEAIASEPVAVQRSGSGSVAAELTYRPAGRAYEDVRLRILRPDGSSYVRRIDEVSGEPDARPSLRVLALGDAEPVVVLDYSTGGAYCCVQSQLYGYDRTHRSYRRLSVNWGSLGYRVVDLDRDGRLELESGDLRLDQYFTSHVLSSTPIRIWRYRAGRLVDVTRAFPARIRAHLADARRSFLEARRTGVDDLRGVVVAYAGDLCLLRRCGEGRRVVAEALSRGEFDRGTFGPGGKAYVRELLSLLRRTRYLRN